MNPDVLTSFIKSALNSDAEIHLQAIDTSGTNQHFRVRVSEDSYFLKVFITNQLQVVNRQQQFQLQAELAEKKLALKPVALSSDDTLWLEEYVEALHPSADSGNLALLLAETLWQIHNLSPSAQELNLQAEWERYSSLAGLEFDANDRKIKALLNTFDVSNEFCFCHNDLHYSHVVLADTNKVLDWEYAAIGNRYFDLAACCVVNQLTPEQISDLAESYAQLSGFSSDNVLSGIMRLKPVVDFTNELWHNAYNNLS